MSARHAYQAAAQGPATQLAPAELHKAHEALQAAEKAFADEPREMHTRDLAYVAQRKAQMADAHAAIAASEARQNEAVKQLADTQDQILDQAKMNADAANANLAASQQDLALSEQALAAAEKARLEADARTAAALAELAAVKSEARGLVITLSGSVLFKSNESTLLPAAQTRLGQVAAALMAEKGRSLVIEGHTDSDGTDEANVQLSQRRAESVRSFLVSQGYDASLIVAHGIGESRPIADNSTPEGKANNRRVEIIIQNTQVGQR